MKPKFIVIEGIDGSGKTTQIKMLDAKLTEMGIKHHVTKEASTGPIGMLLRDKYLSGERKCDERVINRLYSADRLEHITDEENGLLRHLHDGDVVICDRYIMSSLAYDTYSYLASENEEDDDKKAEAEIKYNEAMKNILNLNKINLELLEPDITFYLNIYPVNIAVDRILKRNEAASVYDSYEKLEKIDRSYFNAIRILEERYHENIIQLDGTQSVDHIHERIWEYVEPLIREG